MKFFGYTRPDGKVGIRNHVVVMPGVVCSTVAAQRIANQVKGAVFMETAAYDPISTIGEIAGGCQTVVFTTGMGNPMGCAIAPVIKITGNHQTYEWLNDLLDFDTSANLRGEKTVPQVADELMQLILDVCNGKQTKAELNGADVVVIDQYCMGA